MSKGNRAGRLRYPPDAAIDDVDLDQEEIYYQGERLTEARAAQFGEESARLARAAREAKT